MAPYQSNQLRPETVLKRAEELAKVGQSVTALETLYNALMGRNLRSANAGNTEPFMRKFVEL
ncbi:eukaryotic translation initiation factor 3 subunit A, partial [Coemansia helicoidea]